VGGFMVESKINQASKIHSSKEKTIKNKNKSFSQKEVDLAETPLFFPEGFEKVFLVIYIIALPYIMGLLFLFFVVSDSNVENFLAINEDSAFFLTWAIGYEILAALMMLWIIKMALGFAHENSKPGVKPFVRP
jgi:hypothetical protein